MQTNSRGNDVSEWPNSDGIATTTTKPGFILGKDRNAFSTRLRLFFQEAEYTESYDEA